MVVVRQGLSVAIAGAGEGFGSLGPDTHGEFESHDGLASRYISINDTSRSQRDAWLEGAFPSAQVFSFADDDTKALSRHPDGYGVLIVGGNDIARMARFLKANRAAISGVVKICVTSGSNAQKRAMALHAGFDDVFDSEKMQGIEAAARIEAMRRRYLSAIESGNEKLRSDRLMGEYVAVERLTERERAIVTAMLADNNHFVSYAKVQQLCSDFHSHISFENVKVIICNLRKKLKPGVRIIAQPHKGYMLLR